MHLSISDWLALTVGIEQLEPHVLIIGHNGASGSQAHDSIHVHTAKAKQSTAPTPFMSSVGCLIFCFTFPLLFIRCPIGFPRPVLRSAPERSIDPIPLPAPPPSFPNLRPAHYSIAFVSISHCTPHKFHVAVCKQALNCTCICSSHRTLRPSNRHGEGETEKQTGHTSLFV